MNSSDFDMWMLILTGISGLGTLVLGVFAFMQWRMQTKPVVAFLIRTLNEYKYNDFYMTVQNISEVTAYNIKVNMDVGKGSFLETCNYISDIVSKYNLNETLFDNVRDDIQPLNGIYWWEWFAERDYYGKGYGIKRQQFVKGEKLPEYDMGFGSNNITKFRKHLKKYLDSLDRLTCSDKIRDINKIFKRLDDCKFSGTITYKRSEGINWFWCFNKSIKRKFNIFLNELIFSDRLIPEPVSLKVELVPINNVSISHPNVLIGYNNHSGLSYITNQVKKVLTDTNNS